MSALKSLPIVAVSHMALALSACGGQITASSGAPPINAGALPSAGHAAPASDTTSILKLLKKTVVIGSTVDPTNGDTGPRAISTVPTSYGKLKKGRLLVCNFDDSSGKAGAGTTIEQLDDASKSSPATFIANAKLEGCDGDAISSVDEQVYATGLTSKVMVWVNQDGRIKKSYGAPIADPLGNVYAPPLHLYSPNYIFAGDVATGDIDSLFLGIVSAYNDKPLKAVVTGFPVNKKTGWSALGPSALAYSKKVDTLYVVDGACNAIVSIYGASLLLESKEITIGKDCKTFTCKYRSSTCAKLVLAGEPLDAPEAETLLPNGNLIVANTRGGNTLVETTPKGQVLDTKVVDKSKTAGIFGLLATGTTNSNTALFYTDTNTNTLYKLEQ